MPAPAPALALALALVADVRVKLWYLDAALLIYLISKQLWPVPSERGL